MPTAPEHSLWPGSRTDWTRLVARIFCGIFAVLGFLPLVAGWMVRSGPFLDWVSRETARELEERLGVHASYSIEVGLWPFEVALRNVSVPASDGGTPAILADRIAIAPRLFSLVSGKLDAGEIDVEAPRVRLVIRQGKVQNIDYRLPERSGPSKPLERSPFTSLAATDALVSIDVDGTVVEAGPADLDVIAERGLVFDVAARMSSASVTRTRPHDAEEPAGPGASPPSDVIDEDTLCGLDLRARLTPEDVLVRRLSLDAIADVDPKAGTRGVCGALAQGDPRIVELRVSQLRVEIGKDKMPIDLVDGHVETRGPLALLDRFIPAGPFGGWVRVVTDVRWERGTRLPVGRGQFEGHDLRLAEYLFARSIQSDFDIQGDVVHSAHAEAVYGHDQTQIWNASFSPFGECVGPNAGDDDANHCAPRLSVARTESHGLLFQDLMENIGITKNTIVRLDQSHTLITDFHGTLLPLKLDGTMFSEVSDFQIFDRAYHDPQKRRMLGAKNATVRGHIAARPDSFQFLNCRAEFGHTSVTASVSVGYKNDIWMSVPKGSTIDLADVSPLVDIPWAGRATVEATMSGQASKAVLTGTLSVDDFVMGGFPLGTVDSAKVRFHPLEVDLSDVQAHKNGSKFRVPQAKLDFDVTGSIIADARVESPALDLRDFFNMWHFDEDRRFDDMSGKVATNAKVHYDLGGPLDRCGTGYLRVQGSMASGALDLYEEHYDSANTKFDFRWEDSVSGYLGLELDVPSMELTKGDGKILGSFTVRDGGVTRGSAVATQLPLAKLQSLGAAGSLLDGRATALVEVGGTLDELTAQASLRVSPVRVGSGALAASNMTISLVPTKQPFVSIGTSGCGRPIPGPFTDADWNADRNAGTFHAAGQLFGGQVRFDDLQLTRQRNKITRGKVRLQALDLGAISQAIPALALSESKPTGVLTADLDLESIPSRTPGRARATAAIERMEMKWQGISAALHDAQPLVLENGQLRVPGLALVVTTPGGRHATFDVGGSVDHVDQATSLDLALALRPIDLGPLAELLPRAERARGTLGGKLRVTGPPRALSYSGSFQITDGEVSFLGFPTPVRDIDMLLQLVPGELRITHGSARFGSGTLSIEGAMPLRGFQPGPARATIHARTIGLPAADGVRATVDADLVGTWDPSEQSTGEGHLPRLAGDVTIQSFEYTRPVTMTADIGALTRRGRRTEFESYDPENDFLRFELLVRSRGPLVIHNNLVDAELDLGDEGLRFSGTNQRFGARGEVLVVQGGKIRLRQNEFDIRQGVVRFDDLAHLSPHVDVTAVTEYRRYSSAPGAGATTGAAPDSTSTPGAATAGSAGGRWRITMHAHGDPENLKVDLSSEPELSQDDIFLLLTLGLTRAELDAAQSASAGESVALEALGSLTGADQAVTSAVPVIDDFRFGSAYSSKTGRTEPTVTIGKRLSERIRASVTSGVTESREVRSNVEWQLNPRVSVETSYDNVNDVSSSALGNLGADVRWRLEFE